MERAINDRSFTDMYERHYDALYSYVSRRLPGMEADVVNEVFLTAWRKQIALDHLSEFPWLISVARKCIANRLRSHERQQRLIARVRDHKQPEALHADHVPSLVADVLAGLGETDREVLILDAWDQMDSATAARSLGCETSTYRVRLHRARTRFANAWTEQAKLAAPQVTPPTRIVESTR